MTEPLLPDGQLILAVRKIGTSMAAYADLSALRGPEQLGRTLAGIIRGVVRAVAQEHSLPGPLEEQLHAAVLEATGRHLATWVDEIVVSEIQQQEGATDDGQG